MKYFATLSHGTVNQVTHSYKTFNLDTSLLSCHFPDDVYVHVQSHYFLLLFNYCFNPKLNSLYWDFMKVDHVKSPLKDITLYLHSQQSGSKGHTTDTVASFRK